MKLWHRAGSLVLAMLLLPVCAPAAPQFHFGKKKEEKHHTGELEWMWQYSPPPPGGRENELVRDLRFRPLLSQYLTAPQTFWGNEVDGKYRSLADTAYDFLSEPDKVLADDQRYLSISGCVVHFCASRGLLWVDLDAKNPLVVFSAIEWIKQGKPTSDPGAEYTLWIFPDHAFSTEPNAPNRIPPALVHSIARWSSQPMPGSGIVQDITHAILVDPNGTPHQVPLAAVGVTPPKQATSTSTNMKDPS